MTISHIALAVKDLTVSRTFYESFGMKVIFEGEKHDKKKKFMLLQDNEGSMLELWGNTTAEPLTEDLKDINKIGIKHIAFTVINIEETLEQVKKLNAKVISPIKQGISVKRYVFITDPDNIPIELIEKKSS